MISPADRLAATTLAEQARTHPRIAVRATIVGWRFGLFFDCIVWKLSAEIHPTPRSSTDEDWRNLGALTVLLGVPDHCPRPASIEDDPLATHRWQWREDGQPMHAPTKPLGPGWSSNPFPGPYGGRQYDRKSDRLRVIVTEAPVVDGPIMRYVSCSVWDGANQRAASETQLTFVREHFLWPDVEWENVPRIGMGMVVEHFIQLRPVAKGDA